MSDVTALDKHACPACGAQAEWHPSKQKLICPYCGTESPYKVDQQTGQVQELDLVTALRELPDDERGWQTARRSVRCQSCRAVMVFDPARVGQNCEFCGSPALVDYEEIKAPIRPQSVLPFRVGVEQVRDDLRRWIRGRWFAPNALTRSALVDTVHSVYIPYWTFDAQVICPWRAEAGHYYYVRVRHGNTTKMERRVRWEPAAGSIEHFFDDEPVPGTQGLPLDLLRQVEPFPTSELVPYDTAFLSGHVVEHYQIVLLDAAQRSEEQMHAKLREMCAAQIRGDTYRNLEIFPQFSGRTFKHVLVPVWMLTYTYGARTFQVVANGVTGRIAGRHPYSALKIAFAVLAALLLVAMILLLTGD